MKLDKLKELESLHDELGGLDFGCGCCAGTGHADSVEWANEVFDLFPEIVAMAKREPEYQEGMWEMADRVIFAEARMKRLQAALEEIATCVTVPSHRDYLSPDQAKEIARTALAQEPLKHPPMLKEHQKVLDALDKIATLLKQVIDQKDNA